MSDSTRDEIRDMLGQAMSDPPEPHPWADIERRAARDGGPSTSASRRTGVWLAAAACTIAVVAGFVVLIDSDDDTDIRIDEDPVPTATSTTTAPATTAVPTTTTGPTTTSTASTTPQAESGWTGGLLDNLDTASVRPLESLTDGDVIIPTGPSGWRVQDVRWTGDDPGSATWYVGVKEAPPDNGFGQLLHVTLNHEPTCGSWCRPTGESVTIDGVVWESVVPETIPEDAAEFLANMSLRAQVGDRWVSLSAAAAQLLTGPLLENPPIIEFLEGLRVGSPEVLAAIGEACWRCGVAGAEGDPFAAMESPTATSTSTSDGAPTATSEPPAQGPSDGDTGRPLTELAAGDVLVPTYIPPGLAFQGPTRIHEYGDVSEFSFTLETAYGQYPTVRLWEWDKDLGPLGPAEADDPNHPPVEIAGLTWGWYDFETARIANVGPFSIWVYLRGLDTSEAERFIEGLRAVSVEQFPGPIAVDGADEVEVIKQPR